MKGKILFCSFNQCFEEDLSTFDIKLQITRYTNKGLLVDFIHAPGLSPSEELLNKTNNRWKKLKFQDYELAKMKNGTWWNLYTEEFYLEMSMRPDFIYNYERLKEHLNNGKNIICCCFCEDYDKCHRSLIAKQLIKEGYNVELK